MNSPDRAVPASDFRVHGGRLAAAQASYPGAPHPWIDLSTGICPWPYPIPQLPVECWSRLPDPTDLAALLDAARTAYGISAAADVMAVPGSDLAIALLPRLVPPGSAVAIVAPTYSSHERAWASAGHRVRLVDAPDKIGPGGYGIVVNPNNPDGKLWPVAALVAAAQRLAGGGGFLLVDEAFCDMTPAHSVFTDDLLAADTVVLRSFGKFYGLAGVRLGFAATAHPVGRALAAALSDWPVSGPAIAIGRAALADVPWQTATTACLAAASARLDGVLVDAGFEIVGGTTLFRLARHREAAEVFERLARKGILVRPFADPTLLRFGLPADAAAFARLTQAIGT